MNPNYHYIDVSENYLNNIFSIKDDSIGNLSISRYGGTDYDIYYKVFYRLIIPPVGSENVKISNYVTGLINQKKQFFPCPILIFYVEVEQAEYCYGSGLASCLILNLKLYSKDFKAETRSINIKIEYGVNPDSIVPIISKMIRFINQYIDSGHNILELSIEKLQSFGNNKISFDLFSVVGLIDDLTFKAFDKSQNRVGKENFFWTEYQISNFYDNQYFKSLFLELIPKRANRKYWSKSNDVLHYEFDEVNSYSPSYPTTEVSVSSGLKEQFKIAFAAKFDLNSFLFEEMKN